MREGGRTPSPKASPLLTLPTFGLRPHKSLERITRDCPTAWCYRSACHSDGAKRRKNLKPASLSREIPPVVGMTRGMASGVRVSEFDKPHLRATLTNGRQPDKENIGGPAHPRRPRYDAAQGQGPLQTQTLRLLQCYSVTVHNSEPKVCI